MELFKSRQGFLLGVVAILNAPRDSIAAGALFLICAAAFAYTSILTHADNDDEIPTLIPIVKLRRERSPSNESSSRRKAASAADDDRIAEVSSGSPNSLDPTSFYELQVGLPLLDADVVAQIRETLSPDDREEPWATDACVWRFAVARHGDVPKASALLTKALAWRRRERPDLLTPDEMIVNEGRTGKTFVRFADPFGRPVLVLDSTKENTKNPKNQLKHLVFQLERACTWCDESHGISKRTEICGSDVESIIQDRIQTHDAPPSKYVVVIRLGEIGMGLISGKMPSMHNTKETLKMLTVSYVERMGHAILYKPPRAFAVVWNVALLFIDERIKSKIVRINGDVSLGSKNDKTLTRILGTNWREIVGEGQEVFDKKAVPGFDADVEWEKCKKEPWYVRSS